MMCVSEINPKIHSFCSAKRFYININDSTIFEFNERPFPSIRLDFYLIFLREMTLFPIYYHKNTFFSNHQMV